jgi:cell division inhibitor SepF
MSALRKAGVWLGLVEEEDEVYEIEDEFGDEDDFAPPARPRSLARSTDREPRTDYRRSDSRSRLGLSGERESTARRETLTRSDGRRPSEPRITEPRTPEPRQEREFWGSDRSRDSYGDSPRSESLRSESPRSEPVREEPVRDDPRERGSVRQLSRSTPASATPSVSYPTHDNLALAPQVQLRERAVVADEKTRRYQITTLHPTTYSEARTIGEHFRNGHPVIMNLTELDEPDAKRLVDFAAGLAFGLRGSMERVTNRVFLLSPPNIEVSAEDKAKIAESGFFDQG